MTGNQRPLQSQPFDEVTGVKRTHPTEGHQREFGRVIATLHRNDLDGALTIIDSEVKFNAAILGVGGGIFNCGFLMLINTSVIFNIPDNIFQC